MHQIAACVEKALSLGRVAIIEGGFHGYHVDKCTRWNCIFQDPTNCSAWFRKNRTSAHYKEFSLHPLTAQRSMAKLLKRRDLMPPSGFAYAVAWVRGHILAYLMRPSARVNTSLAKCRNWWPHIDAAMHVRRGDKLWREAQRFEVREYVHHIEHFILPGQLYHTHYGRNYNTTLFVATDDVSVVKDLEQGADYTPYTILHSPLHEVSVSNAETYDSDNHLTTLLCELDRMASAKTFVGTFSSQVSRLVFEMKLGGQGFAGNLRVASLDEDYYL
jgi:hypothetical protein